MNPWPTIKTSAPGLAGALENLLGISVKFKLSCLRRVSVLAFNMICLSAISTWQYWDTSGQIIWNGTNAFYLWLVFVERRRYWKHQRITEICVRSLGSTTMEEFEEWYERLVLELK